MGKNLYNLTSSQKSIWLTEQYYKNTNINNVCGVFEASVPIDFSLLEKSIKLFVKNNESFRTRLTLENGIVKQYFSEHSDFQIDTVLINSNKERMQLEKKINSKKFDLLNSQLFNFTLFKYPNGTGGYIINSNHIIADSWTSGILVNEISEIYNNIKNNENFFKDNELTYSNYIKTEQNYINSEKFNKDKDYWNSIFKNIPKEIATIPSKKQSINNKFSYKAKRYLTTINFQTLEKIKKYAKNNKVSLYNLLIGIFSLYISRVSNLEDFIIGTPILNRTNFKEKQTTGMFINVLPLRININNNQKFKDFISQIAINSTGLLRHQKYSYNYIIEDLRKKDSSIPNLYNILFSYQITKMNENNYNLPHKTSWTFNGSILNDLELHIFEWNDTNTLQIAYDYKISKYSEKEIIAINKRILNIIDQILKNEDISLKEIEIVTEKEKNQILSNFNNTKNDYPKDKTVSQLFEEQVEKTPNNISLIFEEQKLTYKELNEKVNSLANYLNQNGINELNNIGIFTYRSLNTIIGILALLKLNCTFVPIDPEYPIERVEYMINTSKISYMLTSNNIHNLENNKDFKLIDISNYDSYSTTFNKNLKYNSKNNLYIIFTSGSTGKPKGVCLSHQNLINLIYFEKNNTKLFEPNHNHNVLQFATMSFDVSYQEIFSTLLTGNTLVLIQDYIRKNIFELSNYIDKYNIDTLFIPPAYLKLICNNDYALNLISKNVKNIITAGEKLTLTPEIISLLNNNIKIYNHYGPAETHVATSYLIDKNNIQISPSIGSPISNTSIYILDKNLNLCPNNTIGQICISGDCVGNGYFNNFELTKNKFINNPYGKGKLYLTGDLGYYDDNLLYFVGRDDFQVKINGFRIELEEIDSIVNSYKNIVNCITVPLKIKTTGNSLACYFVSTQKNLNINKLKEYISQKLPTYMIPQYFMQLDNLPFTLNGKLDRKKLPLPNKKTRKKIIKPRNKTDEILLKDLSNLLNISISKISIEDSFLDLGGDSLSAINLSAKIQSEFNVEIFVKDILQNPIISEISDLISSKISTNLNENKIISIPKSNYYLTSSAQKSTYFASMLDGENSLLYNIPAGIIFDKLPNIEKLQNCFNELVSRHESFRTYFEMKDGNIVQKILDKVNFKLEISEKIIKTEDLLKEFRNFVKPFDFSKAPLLRSKLIKIENNKAILFIDMHHIISDGTSLSIFITELCKLYNGENLDKTEFTYKDFAYWENKSINSEKFKEAEKFWINQFKNDIPILNLPTNYPKQSIQNFEGSNCYKKISKNNFYKIKKLAKKLNTTPYILLLSIYYILLYNYSSQEDIIIGSPVVNRKSSKFSNIIGMFVNTLALKNKVNPLLSFKEFVNNVKQNTLLALNYQTYPFDELVKNLNIKRDSSRNPLFNVMFTYQNNGYPKISFKNINSKYYIPDNNISKFDLSLEVIPTNVEYFLRFEYSTKLFDKKFIEKLISHYINILKTILENENIKISDIDMLSKKEKNQILNKFNNKKLDYPKDSTLVYLFKKQVEKYPNKIAVSFENQKITYSELDKKSNELASILIKNNVNNGDIVGVCLKRSIELIISIIAILKSGGTYMPMYIGYPKDRLNYMLIDSKSKLLITDSNTQKKFSFDRKIILDNYNSIDNLDNLNINQSISPANLAYVIYTSGSTGEPKGVKITHKNLINYIYSFKKYYKHINNHDSFLASTNISFDVSIWEIFLPLLSGAKLVLYNEEIITDIVNYCNSIINNNITSLYIPPNILEETFILLKNNDNIKINKILVGVEPIKNSTLNKYFTLNPNMCIINGYGPTETTICATALNYKPDNINQEDYVSIGKPLYNNKIYIFNQFMKHQPIGIPGEIYISGDGVGNGYLNKTVENEKNFIIIDNTKFYKTGDLAKWNNDGTISFIGRKDSQVKINGYRIELKEINSIITSFPSIEKAYTIIIQKGKSHQLVSYFLASEKISINNLKSYLQSKLTFYMIPSYLIQIENFPLTVNGKIDTKLLPKPKLIKKNEYIAPRNELEKTFAEILSSLLQIDKISIDDNFFDIGCDSLIAIRFQIEALKKNLDINYNNIFAYPTIRLLSEKKSNDLIYNIDKNYNYDKINLLVNKNKTYTPKKALKFKNNKLLLFGSTGFLGAHILDEYLSSNPNNIVYCIIRKKSLVSSTERFRKKLNFYFNNKYDSEFGNRIFVIEGDIAKEKLGIPDKTLSEVFDTIDIVINSAAIVKHYGDSNLFNSINVKGTQNIVNICKKFNKKLYHISTLSVSGSGIDSGEENRIIYDEGSFYVGQNLNNIYTLTKFNAEKIILEEINNGLNATILRIGNITNRFSDGKFQINISENAFINKIKSILNLGVIQNRFLEHAIEFTPVDYCAKSIINIINTKNDYSILHLFNVNTIEFTDLINYINRLGYKLKPVTNDVFSQTVTTFLNNDKLKDKISGIATDLTKNKLLNYFSQNLINADITNNFLNEIGFSWPILDFEYFKKYFEYFKNINFFE